MSGATIATLNGQGLTPENFYCKESDWIAVNQNNYQWYYDNYPVLYDNNIELPISHEHLAYFYVLDMGERNLTPQENWIKCYEALFSYLLGRLEGVINVKGKTWWQYTMQNIPVAFKRTFEQLTSPFGIPLTLWAVGAIALLLWIKK